MNHYDYHNDPDIREAAEKFDRLLKKSYDDFLLEEAYIPVPFYCQEMIEGHLSLPPFEGTVGSINFYQFFHIISSMMLAAHSYNQAPEEDYVLGCKGLILELFEDYFHKLESHFQNRSRDIISWLRRWRDVTGDILIECFESCPYSPGIDGLPVDNLDLLKQLLSTVNLQYAEYIQSLNITDARAVSNLVLYNFWFDDYWNKREKIKKELSPTLEERQISDPLYNRILFIDRVSEFLSSVIDGPKATSLTREQLNTMKKCILGLFNEYTRIIRISKIEEPSIIHFATEHWKDVTSALIGQTARIEMEKVRLSSYHPGDIVHPFVFKSPNHWKWDLIKEIQSKSLLVIEEATSSYLDLLINGKLKHPWSADILKLKIDFKGLHRFMNDKYFSNISVEVFEDCIISADFSIIEERTINRKKGCIHYLVKRIGEHNERWFDAALSTLKKDDGKPYGNMREFLNTVDENKETFKKFRKELDNEGIALPQHIEKKEKNTHYKIF